MIKITKPNRKDLIDEISQLRQQVIELQSEIIRLKSSGIWREFPVKPSPAPVISPKWETGDDLSNLPMTISWGF